MHEIEIEFKNLLSDTEYQHLAQAYQEVLSPPRKQVNYYFDQDGLLRKMGAALRIRVKAGQEGGQLTLKVRKSLHQLDEIHQDLTRDQVKQMIDLGKVTLRSDMVRRLDLDPTQAWSFSLLGDLTTLRQEAWLNPDHLLVLDHSSYNGLEDYEVELEAKEEMAGQAVFQGLLAQHGIPFRDTPSKISRFLTSLES